MTPVQEVSRSASERQVVVGKGLDDGPGHIHQSMVQARVTWGEGGGNLAAEREREGSLILISTSRQPQPRGVTSGRREREGEGRERGGGGERGGREGEGGEREGERENSKTLFYRDCSLSSIKNLSNN